MDQNILQQTYILERQAQELEEGRTAIENEITELREFEKNISDFSSAKETSAFSSIGKGVFVRTNVSDKELFVEVGKGVLVRKTPAETIELIESQIKKLDEARMKMLSRLEMYSHALSAIANKINSEVSQ